MLTSQTFIFICILATYVTSQEVIDTKETPIDLLQLRHVKVHNYTGPFRAETVALVKNIDTLVMQNCDLKPFDHEVFNTLTNLRKLVVANSIIEREVSDIKNCCKNLREIELINSGFPEPIHWSKIGSWPLERIYIHKENIPAFKDGVFITSTVKQLSVEYSGLETVSDNSLITFSNLEELNLVGNKIKTFNKEWLAPLTSLKVLNLGKNSIEKLTIEQFPSLPNLEKLSIAHNPIKELNLTGLKTKAPKLVAIDISGIENIDKSKVDGLPLVSTSVL